MAILFLITNLYSVLNLVVLPINATSYFDFKNQDNKIFFDIQFEKTEEENIFPIKKANESLGVDISAKSALVKDLKTDKILFSKNINEKRSLASITKLMSAMVLIDLNPDWNKVIEFSENPGSDFNKLKLNVYDKIKFQDLFNVTILSSSNSGIEILIKNIGISRDEFINKMNQKARAFGLRDTFFIDPTGLDNNNISTANEILIFAEKAFKYEKIREISSLKNYSFSPVDESRVITIKNTNELIGSYLTIDAGKTGTTDDAGSCLVSEISYDDKGPILAVVLGSASHFERFSDLKSIAFWVFENYVWQ